MPNSTVLRWRLVVLRILASRRAWGSSICCSGAPPYVRREAQGRSSSASEYPFRRPRKPAGPQKQVKHIEVPSTQYLQRRRPAERKQQSQALSVNV
ncbi:hypothetical protein PYCCODRAFT_1435863 [Trametes coccinea BRFM310]|uniref:Secreted protein n=1 Tax=Trametes coccinea (strain BRFM310) TaxID=1353009 RepID=A0A1Y2IQF1_TRAC3|nr:hypothetical protein PYCCODRAFT_1435863 [Trametes coccinea BRFM310]